MGVPTLFQEKKPSLPPSLQTKNNHKTEHMQNRS